MFLELFSVAIIGVKIVNESIEARKPYKHVMNTPREIQSRKEAQELYDKVRREYEQRTGKKADW